LFFDHSAVKAGTITGEYLKQFHDLPPDLLPPDLLAPVSIARQTAIVEGRSGPMSTDRCSPASRAPASEAALAYVRLFGVALIDPRAFARTLLTNFPSIASREYQRR
jgi:hypothetical protein